MDLQPVDRSPARPQLATPRLVTVSMLEQWVGYSWLLFPSVLHDHQFDSAMDRWLVVGFAAVLVAEMLLLVGFVV